MGGAISGRYRSPNATFRFKMEKEHEDEPLGLNFNEEFRTKGILVHHVGEEGAIVRWNRENPARRVVRGDMITAVNGTKIWYENSWERVRNMFRAKTLEITVRCGLPRDEHSRWNYKRPYMHYALPSGLPSNLKQCSCQSTECAICLDELEKKNNKRALVVLPCGHAFHKDCAQSWLNNSKTWPAHCPVCRSTMPGEQYEVIKNI